MGPRLRGDDTTQSLPGLTRQSMTLLNKRERTDLHRGSSSWMRGSSPRMTPGFWRARFRFADSNFKQPTLRRPYSLIGAGYAVFPIPILRSLEGSGAPADAGVCETPDGWPARPSGGTLCEGVPFLLCEEKGASRRSTAAFCDKDGPRFRERGPATPVSQLLAAGPNACERSPAIARVLQGTFPRSPRRRISRRRGFPRSSTRRGPAVSPAFSSPLLRLHGVP